MNTVSHVIQRQYDEVIAKHYDLDPQFVLGASLGKAITQLRRRSIFGAGDAVLDVLDVGLGTGLFMNRLLAAAKGQARPFGLDLSEKMVEIARQRIPSLQAAVGDAARLDEYFSGHSFDLICTHFITGFVPMKVLAPLIHARLNKGGCWSLVGGTTAGFPALREQADRPIVRKAFGGERLLLEEVVCNPRGREEVVQTLNDAGFELLEAETFEPHLTFKDLDEFLGFAYRGGWLTPLVEKLGLHEAGLIKRMAINLLCFPIEDHHNIEIVLARKAGV